MLTMQSREPPIVPSHVFFGDIFENGVFPIIDPTRYAMVSLIHSEKIMAQGNKDAYELLFVRDSAGTYCFAFKPKSINKRTGSTI